MSYFAISLVCGILCLVFALSALFTTKRGLKIAELLGAVVTALGTLGSLILLEVPTSISISAKTCFVGIKWSEVVSRDIIINSNGEISFIETDEPGESIKEIRADLKKKQLFPGDVVTKDDLSVTGITIAGESVPISDYEIIPYTISAGQNQITVTYQNLENVVSYLWSGF